MAKVWELMDRVYYMIGQGRNLEAQDLIDEVLRMDPQNVDAWEAYMRICQTRRDLEGLKNHIRKIWDTRVRDKDYMQARQRFIIQRVDERINNM